MPAREEHQKQLHAGRDEINGTKDYIERGCPVYSCNVWRETRLAAEQNAGRVCTPVIAVDTHAHDVQTT